MIRIASISLFLLFTLELYSQENLILNPSFEISIGNLERGFHEVDSLKDWSSYSSCDVFNIHASDIDISAPHNSFGYQYPHSYDTYVGLLTGKFADSLFHDANTGLSTYYNGEYLIATLRGSLEKGKYYSFQCSISWGEKSVAHFNEMMIVPMESNPKDLSPESMIDFMKKQKAFYFPFQSDSIDWQPASINFRSPIKAKFLLIGLRDSLDHLIIDRFRSYTQEDGLLSYYYIDDVSLEEVIAESPEFELPNIFSPNGDSHNDFWQPIGSGVALYDLKVFNRNGTLVYSHSNQNIKWDGNNSAGEPLSEGVYIAVVKAKGFEGDVVEKQTTVHLFR